MARPDGLTQKTKDNSRKLHRNHEEWMVGKKIGRQKQVWVPPVAVSKTIGHWEKSNA